MSLSFLDAFGAAAAPGAPPPSALASDGGPVDGADQDAGFVALLDAAALGQSAAGAPGTGSAFAGSCGETSSADDASALPGATPVDPALAAALQAKWWLSALPVSEPAATADADRVAAEDGDAEVPPDAAIDPDDNAAAEWFIASGAVLTALVVVDEAATAETANAGTGSPSAEGDGESPSGQTGSRSNESSPAFAVASRARHDAGVRRSNQPGD